MKITIWCEDFSTESNGKGFDVTLSEPEIGEFLKGLDPCDVVKIIGAESLLDQIPQEEAERAFKLVPSDFLEEADKRIAELETQLADLKLKPVNKDYTEFEDIPNQ